MYHLVFIHSPVDEHLGSFHVLAFVNSASVNIRMHVFFWIMVFSGWMSGSGIAGLYGSSNLPWFMDLTFQVPMQYCCLQHQTLLLSPVTSTAEYFFLLCLHPFILSGVISPLISSSILVTYWAGEFIFQYSMFLPFHTVHGVLKARILKWLANTFSSGPHFVRTLHHDPSILGSLTWHGS